MEYNVQPHVGALVWGSVKDADTGSEVLTDFVLEDTTKAKKAKKAKAKAEAEAAKAAKSAQKEDL